ncbi:DNA-binding response regulator, OmpR family, contains REC and winged-helix (wHTH) domain [Clostridium cavendishii DSM 21758]|uniref:Stage 0 sporulation protein A homolog n=1 Tax=Clostridium cavendishii DSM 21758 TaxID=1121302 RepID=A0A1M6I4N9_9CLOT|nr:response regulator transcription factor [Clostridium cavendishii]SHJ29392.1 DNA-binding response regulator, OmpR family, contains REC and winged-helix (wHTH) domain [Clostridium cavendishii DSM 21758]
MKDILLIEDDIDLSKEISISLVKWGFKVILINDFSNILSEYMINKPALVIIDVNLPFYDGFYWCEKIRSVSKVPIIFLSSRDSNMDLIMGINNGGDDYLTKPFSIEVLITKINAILRRAYDYVNTDNIIYYNDIIFDIEKGIFKYGEKQIELTKNEIRILTLLIRERGKIVSRENLMLSLWNDDEFVNDNSLTVNITRLRNKIKEIGISDFIKTKKGAGYMVE